MGIFGTQKQHRKGFTVVELIIVVTVIAVLASIVIFAYPGYQMRARNNERKSDLTQIAAALNAYALRKNDYMGDSSGCGFLNTGNGWVGLTNPGWYDKSIAKCLEDAGTLKAASDVVDPSGCMSDSGGKCGNGTTNGSATTAPTTAYMKALCTKNLKPVVYVMAYLEGEPRKDAEIDGLCDANSMTFFNATSQKWGSAYGMNYYVKVQ